MRVLIVDDELAHAEMLSNLLQSWGYEAQAIDAPRRALELFQEGHRFDLLITDLMMPEMTGQQLLSEVQAIVPDTEVILMTGYATVGSAVEAMRQGALDYITKPINSDELRLLLDRLKRTRSLTAEVASLRLELRKKYEGGAQAALIGSSPPIRKIIKIVQQVSQSKTTVSVGGESGTGKELVARAIHYSGPTADKPFLAINCGGISPSLLESQLFGHVKGAFTNAHTDTQGYFRAAEGGTLLLDEITEMDPDLQIKLLRVLQEREVTPLGSTKPIPVDIRIIAAANRSLGDATHEGRLRQDLYYRLSVVVIEIPPLRERVSDIPELVQYFNNRFSLEYGVKPLRIPHETLERLMQYEWPGNVRELENVLARAFALAEEEVRLPADFPDRSTAAGNHPADNRGESDRAVNLHGPLPTLSEAEKLLIAVAIKSADKDKLEALHTLRSIRETANTLARGWGLDDEDAELWAGQTLMGPAGEAATDDDVFGGKGSVPTWAEVEKRLLSRALLETNGVKSKAAKLLDIDTRRFNRLLERHGMK